MTLFRLIDDSLGMLEGSCITEDQYSAIPWFNKALFEPIFEHDRERMLTYLDPDYCRDNNIYTVLFYTQSELDNFMRKVYDIGIE